MLLLLIMLLSIPLALHGMQAEVKTLQATAAHAPAKKPFTITEAPAQARTVAPSAKAKPEVKSESKEDAIYFDLTYEKFLEGYKGFMEVQKKLLSNKKEWLDNVPIEIESKEFQPYVQKLIVPAGSHIFILGDLHGDMKALEEFLMKLRKDGIISDEGKIINANTFIIFAGDYTDRGKNGAEVLTTLLHLKMNNPTQVFMARGNHESVAQNKVGDACFYQELKKKFAEKAEAAFALLPALYNSLPAAIFVGTLDADGVVNYMLCCHGAPEICHNPQEFLASNYPYAKIQKNELAATLALLTQQQELDYYFNTEALAVLAEKLCQEKFTEFIDYLWGDLQADPTKSTLITTDSPERCCALLLRLGERLIRGLLQVYSSEKAQVKAIFRAHQHNESHPALCHTDNHGCCRQPWKTPVFTTIGAPGVIEMPVICCALEITTHSSFNQWEMTQHYVQQESKKIVWTSDSMQLAQWENDFNPEWQKEEDDDDDTEVEEDTEEEPS